MEFPEEAMANRTMEYHASRLLAHRANLERADENDPNFHIVTLHP